VHTSAKARLTSIALRTIRIRIRIPDPDRHQNLIVCFIGPCTANLPSKFHANPYGSFCAKLLTTDRQTNRQTTTKT